MPIISEQTALKIAVVNSLTYNMTETTDDNFSTYETSLTSLAGPISDLVVKPVALKCY